MGVNLHVDDVVHLSVDGDRQPPERFVVVTQADVRPAGSSIPRLPTTTRRFPFDPTMVIAHYNRAAAFDQAGRVKDAIEAYRTFLQYAGPDDASLAAHARQRLAVLQGR